VLGVAMHLDTTAGVKPTPIRGWFTSHMNSSS
jgi:hypothetical protein